MCILYALVSSQAKKRRTPYQTFLVHSPSPSITQARCCVGQIAPSGVHGDAALAREAQEIRLAFLVGFGLPGLDGALAKAQRRIGNDQAVVDADAAAEAAAGLASADGRIEAEGAGARILVLDVAVRAMQAGGEAPRRRGLAGGVPVLRVDIDASLADLERRFDGIGGARGVDLRPAKAILNHLQRVAALFMNARVPLGRRAKP